MASNQGYEVRTIEQIDYKNIRLGKTFKYGNDYNLTNLYYLEDNVSSSTRKNTIEKEKQDIRQDAVDEKTKLIIQTPLMFIPNSMIYFNDKPFLELSFNNENNDKDVLEFKIWFQKLEEYIYLLIKRRNNIDITKENMISSIKNYNWRGVSTKLLVPININVSKCILNDDGKRHKILFNWEIPVPTYGISIIWIKNIWIKRDKWGINLFMYATRVMNSHMLDPIDFLGLYFNNKTIRTIDVINKFHKDEKMSILVGQVPEYTMYFKMIKLGIPRDAVKQKMTLLGIDARVIDYPENALYASVLHYISNPNITYTPPVSTSSIPPPPPLPPLPSISIIGIPPPSSPLLSISSVGMDNKSRVGLLNSINAGEFKLKKVEPNQINKDKILANTNPARLKVPSLIDIKNAISRLKKIDINSSC